MKLKLPNDLKDLVGKTVHHNEYEIIEYCDSGKRGHVFRANRELGGQRALKFISKDKLTSGWTEEARKAHLLEHQPNTVRFFEFFYHGKNAEYAVMVFDFVEGESLRDRIENHLLTVVNAERILEDLLVFIRDCISLDEPQRHGDLHPGNIILRKPQMGVSRAYEVMITDFGIGYTGAVKEPKDDLKQAGAITTMMLQSITREDLVQTDRVIYDELCHGAALKKLREHSPLEIGDKKLAIEEILGEVAQIKKSAIEPSTKVPSHTRFGDYLLGEQLGSRWNEWKELFVSGFPGYDDIVSRNTTVLTGTRGCGKTMVFRRLSALLAYEVGPVDDGAAGDLVGIYLNMNDIADAFLYDRKGPVGDNFAMRVIQFFHLSLLSEIVRVSGVTREKASENHKKIYDKANHWIFNFIVENIAPEELDPGPPLETRVGGAIIERARDRIRCSRKPLRKLRLFAQNDWLKRFVPELQKRMPWIGDKPLYFFLDDYSLPRVSEDIQQVLNSVVFQRSDSFFFKISTESPSTLHKKDYSGKELDCPHDFELTDLGSVTIQLPNEDRKRFLDDVFTRRFDRDPRFKNRNLADVLGRFDISWAELARKIRREPSDIKSVKAETKKVFYHGQKVFLNMWSGDTRSMVKIAQNLLEQLPTKKKPTLPIEKNLQDKVFRNTGGEFLHLLKACTRTGRKKRSKLPRHISSWGDHLVKVTEVFKEMCLYELRTRDGGRKGRNEPKQAFRIELIDEFSLEGLEREIYEDLIRHGVFLRDDRGKSVRGAIIPRLYLRRLLIPFFTLTFSRIDHIPLNAYGFKELLQHPKTFFKSWQKEKNRAQYETKQREFEFRK